MDLSNFIRPHRQGYYFAYNALPAAFFGYDEFPRKIQFYPNEFKLWFQYLWIGLAKQLPRELHSDINGLELSAHRLGGKLLVLLVQMPPPQQALEVYFIALVIDSPLRYFTLGMGMGPDSTTIREVWPNGAHGRVGGFAPPNRAAFLRQLCTLLDLCPSIEDLSEKEVVTLAPTIFPELKADDERQTTPDDRRQSQ